MKRLRIAEWAVLVGAAGLLVTLFLDWYGVDGGYLLDQLRAPAIERPEQSGPGALAVGYAELRLDSSGWGALGWLTIALLISCVAAGLLLVTMIAAGATDVYALVPSVVLVVFGLPALIVLLVVVLFKPGLGADLSNGAVALEPAGWAGIGCAVLLVVGGLQSFRDERTTGADRIYTRPPARPAPPA